MADIWLRRTDTGIAPMDMDDLPKAWRAGDLLLATIKKPRNGRLHRKAFVLLDMVFPHTEYPNKDILRKAMTIGAGFVEEIVNPMTGEVGFVAKTWRFDSMDDLEFEELYQRLIDVALRLVAGSKRSDWEDAEQQIARM